MLYGAYPAGGYPGLAAGTTHTVTARNAGLCVSPVSSITISAVPTPPAAYALTLIDPTCTVATGGITPRSVCGDSLINLMEVLSVLTTAGGYTEVLLQVQRTYAQR